MQSIKKFQNKLPQLGLFKQKTFEQSSEALPSIFFFFFLNNFDYLIRFAKNVSDVVGRKIRIP